MKILLIEPDRPLAGFIRRGLREKNHAVDMAADGEEGHYRARTQSYDLVVLDRCLPKKTGLEVVRSLRQEMLFTPVLMLSAKRRPLEKAEGLDAGADDYLAKPFLFEEFLARVRALLRRRGGLEPERLCVGGLEIDTLSRCVTRDGREITLTAREYALLEFFARRAGQVVTRTALAEGVWERDFDSFSNVIDVLVARLRRKIDREFESKLLRTVRGAGYRFGSFSSRLKDGNFLKQAARRKPFLDFQMSRRIE